MKLFLDMFYLIYFIYPGKEPVETVMFLFITFKSDISDFVLPVESGSNSLRFPISVKVTLRHVSPPCG